MIKFHFLLLLTAFASQKAFAQNIKLLVATGYAGSQGDDEPKSKAVDIIDMLTETNECSSLTNLTAVTVWATGSLVSDRPMICGGYNEKTNTGLKDCFQPGNATAKAGPLKVTRFAAASVTIGQKLWVTGGTDDSTTYKTTEYVGWDMDTTDGPELPVALKDHCLVAIDANKVMLLGGDGSSGATKKTYLYDFSQTTPTKVEKAEMSEAKSNHGCALFRNKKNGDKLTVAAVGGNTKTVEFYDVESNTWSKGPDLPKKLTRMATLTNPDGDGIVVVGGESDNSANANGMSDEILEMECDASECKWEVEEQKLKAPRSELVAMFVPHVLTTCNLATGLYVSFSTFFMILFSLFV